MMPLWAEDDAVRRGERLARLRHRLGRLCHEIAEVEDSLAGTFDAVARTTDPVRAERLTEHAAAARQFAAQERAQAQRYESLKITAK